MTLQISDDGFLGGRLKMLQPVHGYRAATDPVFMAAAVAATPGQSVLELGCGAGVALGCLLRRVPDIEAFGLEIQPEYADLARQNMLRNGISARIVEGDLAQMPVDLREKSFDHVMMNPPFFQARQHSKPHDQGKSTAFIEGNAGLGAWLEAGMKRLKPMGWLTIIHRAERLPEILAGLKKAGDIHILPLASRQGRAAGRVIVLARKGAMGPLKLLAPLILHQGAAHGADGDDFTKTVSEILRNGAALLVNTR